MKISMISTERRQVENARIPCAIPVELAHDEQTPGFEAAAVDLSAGGLSLRASSLPEVGATLHCRFESLPGGTQISGRGEVVWARLSGERSGEFGLRFTEIEPEAQALISEMIAERVAQASGSGGAPRQPRTATLELEHVEAPITAKLTRAVGRDFVFEQPLDVLALGSGVVAHGDKNLGRGNILRVDLRMDGGTPTLALTVRFSEGQEEYGEFDLEADSGTQPRTSPGEVAAAPEGDTVPDLAAPPGAFEEPSEPPRWDARDEDTQPDAVPQELAPRATLIPAKPMLTPVGQPGFVRAHSVNAHAHAYAHAQAAAIDGELADDDRISSVHEYEAIEVSDYEPEPTESLAGAYQPLQLSAADVERLDRRRAISESARKSPLVRFLRIIAAFTTLLETAFDYAKRGATALHHRIEPHLRRRIPRRAEVTTTLRGVGTRPRRSVGTATLRPFEPIPRWTRGAGRLALLAICMLACVVMGVSYLAPSPNGEHVEAQDEFASEDAVDDVATALETDESTSLDPMLAPATPAARLPQAKPPAASSAAAPKQHQSAADTLGSSLSFGHKQVPNAQRFLLRMNAPVTELRGKSTPDGFSVVIPGSHSLDRAAPIAATSTSVAQARILNRNGFAELSVRFVEGKNPAYRVSARQAGLEVLIGP